MQLTLIRHAQTPWNKALKVQGQADPPLSSEGIIQAEKLHHQLKQDLRQYSTIYSSPMQRALHTASILRGEYDIPLIEDERLKSRNLGDFSGRTLADLQSSFPKQYLLWKKGDLTFRPPNGESTYEMVKKLTDFLDFIRNRHANDDRIIIVTHRESVGALMKLISDTEMNGLTDIKNCTPYDFNLKIS